MSFANRDLRIGIDFDNTIVNYDSLFYRVALEKGLVDSNNAANKEGIRSHVREQENGEFEWQKLQAHVYTRCMHESVLINGVVPFIKKAREQEIQIFIVSHKTQFANHDTSGIDLRVTALEWMRDNGFFDKSGLAFQEEQIFFESSRIEKINRIKRLNCTHFIDDLEEIFFDKEFPEEVIRILFAPSGNYHESKNLNVFSDWAQISDYFFSNKIEINV